MLDKRKPRILVLDRDLGTLNSLEALLTREGYGVTLCMSFAEAPNAVAGQRPDLVIAGTRDPENNGMALVWKITDLWPETRVVLLLESDCAKSYLDMMAAGADAFLKRPYTEHQVLERAERLLGAVSA